MARPTLAMPAIAAPAAMVALAACAATVASLEHLPQASNPPADCALEIRFGSICCGPDRVIEDRIRTAALADARVLKAYGWGWGEEGESSLCLVLRSRANAVVLAAQYKAWIALRPQPVLTSVEVREP